MSDKTEVLARLERAVRDLDGTEIYSVDDAALLEVTLAEIDSLLELLHREFKAFEPQVTEANGDPLSWIDTDGEASYAAELISDASRVGGYGEWPSDEMISSAETARTTLVTALRQFLDNLDTGVV